MIAVTEFGLRQSHVLFAFLEIRRYGVRMIVIVLSLLVVTGPVLWARGGHKMVTIFVCHTSLPMAEIQAKAMANGRELAVVSRCVCHSIHDDFKSEVAKIDTLTIRGMSFEIVTCKHEKVGVYACSCTGFENY